MKTTVEPLEGNKVRLLIEVDESELEPAIDAAFRRIAREIRLPGFRPGKAPRKVIEARLGKGVAREEALREALPGFYAEAVSHHEVDVIAAPEIEVTAGQEAGPVSFDAVVEVRPRVEVEGYRSLRVEIPSPHLPEEEVDEHIGRIREQYAEVMPVQRPAEDGDFVKIDVEATRDGERLDYWCASGYLYEVGSASAVRELDENLRGASAGERREFSGDDHVHDDDEEPADHGPIEFVVDVLEVNEKVLPELTDEWVAEATDVSTVEELRDDLRERLRTVRVVQANAALREKTAEVLGTLVDLEPPEPMVAAELQHRLQDLSMRLQAQGVQLEQYLAMTRRSPEELFASLRESAAKAVLTDLALRAVADAEDLEVTDEELVAELVELAERVGEPLERVRADLESSGHIPEVRSDLRKRKALDWLIERVEIADAEGGAIDRADLAEPGAEQQADEEPRAEEVSEQ